MSAPATVAVDSLAKAFGSVRALDGVSLRVGAGEIYGLLGPNGAGKTTLIRSLIGLIRADAGTVTVLGHRLPDRAVLAEVGYMPQSPALYADLTVEENVRFFAAIHGLGGRPAGLLVAEALELQEALAAEVVRAAFEHCPAHRSLEATGHEREVLVGELVLQSLCRRGHDDALGREHSRNEIGERLACTRAGGHGDIASGGECLGDRLGHLELAGPKLAGRKRRHDALQQLGDFGFGHMRTLPEPSALARPRAQAFARPRKMLPPRNTMTTSGRTTTARSLW